MDLVLLVEKNLDVHLPEPDAECRYDSLQFVVYAASLQFGERYRHFLPDGDEWASERIPEALHLAVQHDRPIPYEDVAADDRRESPLDILFDEQYFVA